MEALQAILEGALGQFVCTDAGIYRGQCPQLPRYMAKACGVEWNGYTYNGNKTVDRVVELGGYYGESAKGYRIASCDVSGSSVGHTWVEIKINGKWVIYEQNANRAGAKSANFGCGTCYSVTKTTAQGSWRKNVRYAAHPTIDAYIETHTLKPQPQPEPTPAPTDGFKVGDKVVPTRLVDYNGTPLRQWDDVYTITELNGNRAVLCAPRNGEMVVWAALRTEDIRKA